MVTQIKEGKQTVKKNKVDLSRYIPYAAVLMYMFGLVLAVSGRMLLGIFFIVVGSVVGIYVAINRLSKRYVPARRHIPKWMQFFGIREKHGN